MGPHSDCQGQSQVALLLNNISMENELIDKV